MNNAETSHPADTDLLRFQDGELPRVEADLLQEHLEACQACRTRMAEFGGAIADYVRYRDRVLNVLLPSPPKPWDNLQARFEEVDASLAPPPLTTPPPRSLLDLRPALWLATAACLVLGFLLILRFQRVPTITASELLARATAAPGDSDPQRRIEVKTRRRTFLRSALITPAVASETEDLKRMFEAASFSWEDPLSAHSYAAWRDRLPEKREQVEQIGNDVYVIRTATSANVLRRATLTLRARDLRPVREMLEFTTETVEIADAPVPAGVHRAEAQPAAHQTASPLPPSAHPVEAPSVVTQELRVFSALHRVGADLGEPVEIRQQGPHVIVIGTGLPRSREEQVRASLARIPDVEVRFEEPSAAPSKNGATGDTVIAAPGSREQQLETLLGSRESVEDFTNRALDASDAMMARVYALRALARAFRPGTESGLNAADHGVLIALRNDHTAALAQRMAELQRILLPVIPGPLRINAASAESSWQAAAESLFSAAQALDDSLNMTLAGSRSAGAELSFEKVAPALSRVQAQFAAFDKATR